MTARIVCATAIVLSGHLPSAQPPVSKLVEALRPALPYPEGDEAGMQPATGGDAHRWFVIWPAADDDPRVIVRANPLHPETQRAVAEAEAAIQRAVAAAERRAQAAYDRALDEFRRTGKGSSIESITLDDEGVAGQRIDADLELTIALVPLSTLQVQSGIAPTVAAGTGGASWLVRIPANEYLEGDGAARRTVFHAAEAYLAFGEPSRPDVSRLDDRPLHAVTWAHGSSGFLVVLRGNASLLDEVLTTANWSRLVQP
jgi:hypothetical protein